MSLNEASDERHDELRKRGRLRQALTRSDIAVATSIGPRLALTARIARCRLIYDAYDPVVLEMLEAESHLAPRRRQRRLQRYVSHWCVALHFAEGLVCASERQRDLLIGALTATGRVTADLYASDPTLRTFVDVVPFGLPPDAPRSCGTPLRDKFGLQQSDFVLIWGGGIWDWFDPLTLVRAIAKLAERRSDIKLVFLGVTHPKPEIPEPQMAERTVALARDLGVLDKHVFVNWGWVPYEDRARYLLDADAGVSISRSHVEGRFAFRTRILDYIWCGLPIICTAGDWAAEIVHEHRLGEVVPTDDVVGLAAAIERLADNAELRTEYNARATTVRAEMTWERVTQALEPMIERAVHRPLGRRRRWTEIMVLTKAGIATRMGR
jgi:glycosyltransferase involved in cell wall biosynthesis